MVKRTVEQPSDDGSGMEGESGSAPVGDDRDGGIIDGIPVIEPGTLAGNGGSGDSGGESTKRRRGRPAGGGSGARRATQKEVQSAVKGIEPLLLSLHKGVAGLLKSPEFELDPDEAKTLAENMTNVANHYSMTVDPKTVAWIGLFGCLIGIYGPRIGAVIVRRKMPQKNAIVVKESPQQGGLQSVKVEPFYPPQSFGN